MGLAPLYCKYATASGNLYLFDVTSGEIIRVDETVYTLIDDFRILRAEELLEKYSSWGQERVHAALEQLEGLQEKGVLCDHAPQRTSRPEIVRCEGKDWPFAEFLRSERRALTLNITDRCNLRCEYCTFGRSYSQSQFREHGGAVLDLATAQAAITAYLDHRPRRCSVGFFGGEPLLEWELLQTLVAFTEELAQARNIDPHFHMATNGTLLNDDVIHYLVKHRFSIWISLDGPKEVHDRWRVFAERGEDGQKRGSYDVVMANMRRFVELYPDYPDRRLNLTVTATADTEAINELLRTLAPFYPNPSIAFVRDTPQARRRLPGPGVGEGQYHPDVEATIPAEEEPATCGAEVPDWDDWTEERAGRMRASDAHFVQQVCDGLGLEAAEQTFPLFCVTLRNRLRWLHHRGIFSGNAKVRFACRCIPGSLRTFCSTQGVYYPCERMLTPRLSSLGESPQDIDVDRALRLLEAVRLLGDCANCAAQKGCVLCPAMVSERGSSGDANALDFQAKCRGRLERSRETLAMYTSIMEHNATFVDQLLPGAGAAATDDITIVPTPEQLQTVEVGIESLEECP